MHVAILNWRDLRHPQAGGAELLCHQQSVYLSEAGHRVTLFSAGFEGADPVDHGLPYSVVRLGNRFTVYAIVARYLKREASRSGVDVILEHVNGVPWMTPLWSPVPSAVFLYHLVGRTFLEELPFPMSVLGFSIERVMPVFYQHTRAACLGPGARREFSQAGYPLSAISVIPPGHTSDKKLESPAKTTLPSAVALGPLKWYKRHDLILRAWRQVLRLQPDASLKITGWARGDLASRLRGLMTRLELDGTVEFTGQIEREELSRLLARSWCLVYASEREGWGLGVTEAAALGTPTVAFDTGGLHDALTQSGGGILVPGRDPAHLGKAIYQVFSSRELRDELTTLARLRASQFTWERHGSEIEKLLLDVKARKR